MIVPERLAGTCMRDAPTMAWLAGVPAVLSELARRWSLDLGPHYDPGGCCSWAVRARLPDGTPAVLKVSVPEYEGEHEADGLRVWDGDGTVRLLDEDPAARALLLERCEPGTPLRSIAAEPEQDEIVAGLLRRLWRPPPAAHPFRTLEELVASWWKKDLLALGDRYAGRLGPGLVEDALRLFEELEASAPGLVMLATDLHAENILAARREPWLVIDPKPFVGDPAFDATQHLFNCLARVTAEPRATVGRFATLLGVDAERVRGWMFARAVAEALESWSRSDPRGDVLARCARGLA